MFKSLKGIITFYASGTKLYSFINAVRESNIICMSQNCKSGVYSGKIYSYHLKKLNQLAELYDIDIDTKNKHGAIFKLKKYKYRIGIPIGALLAFGFIFYMSNIILTIEVTGNSSVTSQQIIRTLNDIGICKGGFIPDIDFAMCEKKLKVSIDELSWVGIRHSGNRVVVDVDEAVKHPEMLSSNIPCNIISAKDAQITSVKVYNGSLTHIIGDGVKSGDILISGIYSDSKGNIMQLHAMGEIIGIYQEKIEFEQPLQAIVRTAQPEITTKSLDLFTFRIPLYIKKPQINEHDYSEKTNYYQILGKKLPFGIVHSSYTPFSEITMNYNEQEALTLLDSKMQMHENNFYKDIAIKNRDVVKTVYDDKICYQVTYTLEGNIGKQSEIYIK